MERSSSKGVVEVLTAILVMILVMTDQVQARDYDPQCRKNCENKCQNVELRDLCVEMCLRTDCMHPPASPGQEALYYCNRACTNSMCTNFSSAETIEGCVNSCSKSCSKVYAHN